MLVKLGVYGLDNLHPSMRLVKKCVEKVWGSEEAVISSAGEGTHSAGSFHYPAPLIQALDFRLPKNPLHKIEELQKQLDNYSKYYQVVLEEDHIHVEYDDKELIK